MAGLGFNMGMRCTCKVHLTNMHIQWQIQG